MQSLKAQILEILSEDCRTPLERIAVMTGSDLTQVAETVEELERDRVILQYSPIINWDRTDKERVEALIEVKVTPQRGMGYDKIAERIYQFNEVESIYLMSGAFDFTVFITGKTMREVALFVADKLAPIDQVISTATHFVLKKYKDHGTVIGETREDERQMITP